MIGRVRLKICGITHPDDAQAAVDAGADLIGLNFVADSPRHLDVKAAAAIAERVSGQIECVGVFQDALGDLDRVLRFVDLDRVQLHGSEPPEEVEQIDLPVIKALRGADREAADQYPGAILLLDHPTEGGGQGKAWDWTGSAELIGDGYDVILAGGLTPDNVASALASLGGLFPWGVDVATGVEGEGERKDPEKIRAFIEAVRKAEESG